MNKVSIFDLVEYFPILSQGLAALIDQVCNLMRLILVMPATNATSERSFSALRRVKSYLRSTMLQERLNYLMLLHVHNKTLGRALDPRANGIWLSKLTE